MRIAPFASALKALGMDICKIPLHNPFMQRGYARISTDEPFLDHHQRGTVTKAGGKDVFLDLDVSGIPPCRLDFEAALFKSASRDHSALWWSMRHLESNIDGR
jgi:hypothetical protein